MRGGPPDLAADASLLAAALTAASQLTFLDLGHNRICPQPYFGPEEHRPPRISLAAASLPELQVTVWVAFGQC